MCVMECLVGYNKVTKTMRQSTTCSLLPRTSEMLQLCSAWRVVQQTMRARGWIDDTNFLQSPTASHTTRNECESDAQQDTTTTTMIDARDQQRTNSNAEVVDVQRKQNDEDLQTAASVGSIQYKFEGV
jgi:hypothetical protein